MRVSLGLDRPPSSLKRFVHSFSLLAGLVLPLLGACSGSLDSNFPPATGSGGSGTTGSGGRTGADGGTGTGGASGTCDAPTQILKPTCGMAGCHMGPNPTFPPDLTTNPVTALVGVAAVSSTAPCEGQPLINHANPASSVILARISGTTCGPQMPYFLTPLSASDMACLTSWVEAQ